MPLAACFARLLPTPGRRVLASLLLLLFALTGCGSRTPGTSEGGATVDPNSPAASGYGALPLPGQPTLLTERPLLGLYSTEPSADTLTQLGTGAISQDGRFRAVLTDQGAWIVRVDGAWLWQVQLPAVSPTPAGTPGTAGTTTGATPATGTATGTAGTTGAATGTAAGTAGAATGATPAPATVAGPVQWTPDSNLALRDSAGRWWAANTTTTQVSPMTTAFEGATGLTFSPDGSKVFFYKGTQLITALRDGSQARLVGENLVGAWAPDGTLQTTKKAPAPGTPGTTPR